MSESLLRQELVLTAQQLDQAGLMPVASGNLSVRCGDGFLVTPSGTTVADLTSESLVWMGFDGQVRGELVPSSEWRFHRDILLHRPEFNAVVHTHSTFAVTVACLGWDIPAFHYMVAVAGGDTIRCAPYATFGTQELSDHALKALENRKACLLAHHGLLAAHTSLTKARQLAHEVELLCEQYWRVRQMGEAKLLSQEEMAVVIEKFGSYGQMKKLKP